MKTTQVRLPADLVAAVADRPDAQLHGTTYALACILARALGRPAPPTPRERRRLTSEKRWEAFAAKAKTRRPKSPNPRPADRKARPGALVPGVSLYKDDAGRWRARATVTINRRQRVATWNLEEHTVRGAIQKACALRFKYAPGAFESSASMLDEALRALGADEALKAELRRDRHSLPLVPGTKSYM